MGVVPVEAGIRELDPVREDAADLDRCLRVDRDAVVAVVEPEAVPVDGRLDVTVVRDVDDDLGPLVDVEGRPGDRAVVGDHPDGRPADVLDDGRDLKGQSIAVAEPMQGGSLDQREARRVAGKQVGCGHGRLLRRVRRVQRHAASAGRSSRTSPSRIRMIRSAAAPTSGSWVTIRKVWPRSRLKRRRRARTSAVRAESRLPVGSSPSTSEGRLTSARAIATRCCSPPESSAGRCCARSARPTRSSAASASVRPLRAAVAGVLRGESDVLGGAERRNEVVGLEDEAQMFARGCACARRRRASSCHGHRSRGWARGCRRGRAVEQAEDVHEGRFAGSGRAHDRDHLAGLDRDVDPAQGLTPSACRAGRSCAGCGLRAVPCQTLLFVPKGLDGIEPRRMDGGDRPGDHPEDGREDERGQHGAGGEGEQDGPGALARPGCRGRPPALRVRSR